MSFSLYDAVVPGYLQILQPLRALIDRAESFASEKGAEPAEFTAARLAEDMLPFGAQIKFASGHSAGALSGLEKGVFHPDMSPAPLEFTALRQIVDHAIDVVESVDPATVNSCIGKNMAFVYGERRLDFTAENYLLSFAQPNFYFHATTAYDILRWKGLPLGKRDYMGKLRLKV